MTSCERPDALPLVVVADGSPPRWNVAIESTPSGRNFTSASLVIGQSPESSNELSTFQYLPRTSLPPPPRSQALSPKMAFLFSPPPLFFAKYEPCYQGRTTAYTAHSASARGSRLQEDRCEGVPCQKDVPCIVLTVATGWLVSPVGRSLPRAKETRWYRNVCWNEITSSIQRLLMNRVTPDGNRRTLVAISLLRGSGQVWPNPQIAARSVGRWGRGPQL